MIHTMKKKNKSYPSRLHSLKPLKSIIGWQEWCALPTLHIPAIKAKIDTGAKTSALHAWEIRPFQRQGESLVHFVVHPIQRNTHITLTCTAPVVDQRYIMNSGGDRELRYIIKTYLTMGNFSWEIELSLTNRDSMAFRMLLGRDALKGHSFVDPGKILTMGEFTKKEVRKLYGYKRS
jgi:ribosomal protein S6--L-glutamate ligase